MVDVTDQADTKLVNSYEYDLTGNLLKATEGVPNVWKDVGGYFDNSTELYKFGTRYYDASLGRWTQQDPVGGSLGNPDSLNRYMYANDDCVNVTDPSGKLPCWLAGTLALLIVIALALSALAPPLDLLGFIIYAIGGFTTGIYAFDALIQACNPGAIP